jgi:formylglycine-generating enzyme required for sulfatase activity
VTVTEAHCFAEWLGGRLPKRAQWRKAAGLDEDTRQGPFDGDPRDKKDVAVGLEDGPKPVDWGERDRSLYGCRQMASNGYEWTRDLADNVSGKETEILLEEMLLPRSVIKVGQSYLSSEPLTFAAMAAGKDVGPCTEASCEVSFRVVLER